MLGRFIVKKAYRASTKGVKDQWREAGEPTKKQGKKKTK